MKVILGIVVKVFSLVGIVVPETKVTVSLVVVTHAKPCNVTAIVTVILVKAYVVTVTEKVRPAHVPYARASAVLAGVNGDTEIGVPVNTVVVNRIIVSKNHNPLWGAVCHITQTFTGHIAFGELLNVEAHENLHCIPLGLTVSNRRSHTFLVTTGF